MKSCKDCAHSIVCAVYAPDFDDVMAKDGKCSAYLEQPEAPQKPIIRHCKNCKWCSYSTYHDFELCDVRYHFIKFPRIGAILCRYYRQKEGADK